MRVDPILRDSTARDPDLLQAQSRALSGTPSGLVGQCKPDFDATHYREVEGTARRSAATAAACGCRARQLTGTGAVHRAHLGAQSGTCLNFR